MFMKKLLFQIMVDDEETDMFYVADSKADAIRKHIKRCAELYWMTFNKKPNARFFDGIDAKEVQK